MLQIACDGSCLGNPGPGGWAALIVTASGEERDLSGGEQNTTNNRM
ncbi:MAG: ribonuclease HI, partial [Acidobacteria bacterium]|nr:ribonuclease HI [Acidobacteriota bacterium]